MALQFRVYCCPKRERPQVLRIAQKPSIDINLRLSKVPTRDVRILANCIYLHFQVRLKVTLYEFFILQMSLPNAIFNRAKQIHYRIEVRRIQWLLFYYDSRRHKLLLKALRNYIEGGVVHKYDRLGLWISATEGQQPLKKPLEQLYICILMVHLAINDAI